MIKRDWKVEVTRIEDGEEVTSYVHIYNRGKHEFYFSLMEHCMFHWGDVKRIEIKEVRDV